MSTLADAAAGLRMLAAELTAAHTAGWWLVESMRSGHLLAARASRRRRDRPMLATPPPTDSPRRPMPRWRLRVVDEPPVMGEDVLDTDAVVSTPVLRWTGHCVDHVGGPPVPREVLAGLLPQVTATGLAAGRWGVAAARFGPNVDLVAAGSALRSHAVRDGALVRTREALTFQHAADGAGTLLQAAARYEELAGTVDAMVAAGGRLVSVDDGFLVVGYGRTAS